MTTTFLVDGPTLGRGQRCWDWAHCCPEVNGPRSVERPTTLAVRFVRDGVVHSIRANAEADQEHFDGRTTE
jgi:hypothetical protein